VLTISSVDTLTSLAASISSVDTLVGEASPASLVDTLAGHGGQVFSISTVDTGPGEELSASLVDPLTAPSQAGCIELLPTASEVRDVGRRDARQDVKLYTAFQLADFTIVRVSHHFVEAAETVSRTVFCARMTRNRR
jgi:hypothetical protein